MSCCAWPHSPAAGEAGAEGGAAAATSTFDVLLGDAPVDTLSALEVEVIGVFASRASGAESANLLSSPRVYNLLDLESKSALLQVAGVAPGTYSEARIVLGDRVQARDRRGEVVPIRSVSNHAAAVFPQPFTVAAGAVALVHFEIDVESSVTDDSSGGLVFAPVLRLSRRGDSNEPLDEIHGMVVAVDPVAGSLQVALEDQNSRVSHGRLSVQIGATTVLLDDDGNRFADRGAFFLAAPGSRIEAHGALAASGVFQASQVKIEDDRVSVARIEGTLTDLDRVSRRLRLRIEEIERGRSRVLPVLQGLGDPAEIEVDASSAAVVIDGPDARRGSLDDLAIGQELKVRFSAFDAPRSPRRRSRSRTRARSSRAGSSPSMACLDSSPCTSPAMIRRC